MIWGTSQCLTPCCAQSTLTDTIAPFIVNTTGGNSVYGNISFEWSIGEAITTETMSASGTVVTHGVLQPLPTSRYPETQWSADEIKVYPVPARDRLTIEYFSIEVGSMSFMMYDAAGKLVYVKQFHYDGQGFVQYVDVSRYASGVYFLRITLDIPYHSQSIQKDGTYKIQVLR